MTFLGEPISKGEINLKVLKSAVNAVLDHLVAVRGCSKRGPYDFALGDAEAFLVVAL